MDCQTQFPGAASVAGLFADYRAMNGLPNVP